MRAFCSDFGHVPHSTESNVSSSRSSLSTGLSSVSCLGGYISILDVVAAESLNLKTVPTLATLPLETSAKVLCSVSIEEAGLWIIGSSSGIYIFDQYGNEGVQSTTSLCEVNGKGGGTSSQFILTKFTPTFTEVKCLDAKVVKLPTSSFADLDEFQHHALMIVAGGSYGAQVHIWSPLPQQIAARYCISQQSSLSSNPNAKKASGQGGGGGGVGGVASSCRNPLTTPSPPPPSQSMLSTWSYIELKPGFHFSQIVLSSSKEVLVAATLDGRIGIWNVQSILDDIVKRPQFLRRNRKIGYAQVHQAYTRLHGTSSKPSLFSSSSSSTQPILSNNSNAAFQLSSQQVSSSGLFDQSASATPQSLGVLSVAPLAFGSVPRVGQHTQALEKITSIAISSDGRNLAIALLSGVTLLYSRFDDKLELGPIPLSFSSIIPSSETSIRKTHTTLAFEAALSYSSLPPISNDSFVSIARTKMNEFSASSSLYTEAVHCISSDSSQHKEAFLDNAHESDLTVDGDCDGVKSMTVSPSHLFPRHDKNDAVFSIRQSSPTNNLLELKQVTGGQMLPNGGTSPGSVLGASMLSMGITTPLGAPPPQFDLIGDAIRGQDGEHPSFRSSASSTSSHFSGIPGLNPPLPLFSNLVAGRFAPQPSFSSLPTSLPLTQYWPLTLIVGSDGSSISTLATVDGFQDIFATSSSSSPSSSSSSSSSSSIFNRSSKLQRALKAAALQRVLNSLNEGQIDRNSIDASLEKVAQANGVHGASSAYHSGKSDVSLQHIHLGKTAFDKNSSILTENILRFGRRLLLSLLKPDMNSHLFSHCMKYEHGTSLTPCVLSPSLLTSTQSLHADKAEGVNRLCGPTIASFVGPQNDLLIASSKYKRVLCCSLKTLNDAVANNGSRGGDELYTRGGRRGRGDVKSDSAHSAPFFSPPPPPPSLHAQTLPSTQQSSTSAFSTSSHSSISQTLPSFSSAILTTTAETSPSALSFNAITSGASMRMGGASTSKRLRMVDQSDKDAEMGNDTEDGMKDDDESNTESNELRQSRRKRRGTSPTTITDLSTSPLTMSVSSDADTPLSTSTGAQIGADSSSYKTYTFSLLKQLKHTNSLVDSDILLSKGAYLQISPLGYLPLSADVSGLTSFEQGYKDKDDEARISHDNEQIFKTEEESSEAVDEIIGAIFDCEGTVSVISKGIYQESKQVEEKVNKRIDEESEWTLMKKSVGVFSSITASLKKRLRRR
jgi:hypothetical protein